MSVREAMKFLLVSSMAGAACKCSIVRCFVGSCPDNTCCLFFMHSLFVIHNPLCNFMSVVYLVLLAVDVYIVVCHPFFVLFV